jgi:sarcosine oxidase
VTTTGGLNMAVIGTPGEAVLDDYERTLAPGLAIERLEAAEIRRRWPQWEIGDDVRGLFQERGGILDIRRATAAHIALARARGVSFLADTAVRRVRSTDRGVAVVTDAETFHAEALVICAGSWTSALLDGLGVDLPITLSQEQVSYFATAYPREFACERFPIWIWHGADVYYGFPIYGEVAVKAARDMAGRFIEPDARSYEPLPEETEVVAGFLEARLPRAAGPELYSKTCVYDMPPDRDFVIDTLPGHPRIALAIGAGHAAKFASLIGEILAELALNGVSRHPIEAFRADRPALSDPGFTKRFRLVG